MEHMMTTIDTIERTLELPISREPVWKAITDPQHITKWFSDYAEVELKIGGKFNLTWDEHGKVCGFVETLEPMDRFAFRWEAMGTRLENDHELNTSNSTLVTFTLEDYNGGIRLRVIETGFATLPVEIRQAAHRENEGGWTSELGELVEYLSA
jgi:uncharacterized protein YndB with AHSA1/START domain